MHGPGKLVLALPFAAGGHMGCCSHELPDALLVRDSPAPCCHTAGSRAPPAPTTMVRASRSVMWVAHSTSLGQCTWVAGDEKRGHRTR